MFVDLDTIIDLTIDIKLTLEDDETQIKDLDKLNNDIRNVLKADLEKEVSDFCKQYYKNKEPVIKKIKEDHLKLLETNNTS